MAVYKWIIVAVCVLCGMLRVSDFVKGMQFNICTFAYGHMKKVGD